MFGKKNDPDPGPEQGPPPERPTYDDPVGRPIDYRDDGIGRTDYQPTSDGPTGEPRGGSWPASGHDSASDQTVAIDRDQLGLPATGPAYADPGATSAPDRGTSYGSTRDDYVDHERTAAFHADEPSMLPHERPEDRFATGAGPAAAGYGATSTLARDRDGIDDAVDPNVDERAKSGYRISTLGGLLLGVVRILIGFQFLWAFLDKTFGLGFATPNDRAWINGGKPTEGYLQGVIAEDSDNPFKPMFEYFLNQSWTDWLFMAGLLGVGVALILGILTWVAAIAGAAMLLLMYLASWPIASNPFLDDHLLNAVVLIALAAGNAGTYLGLGKPWRTRLAHRVRKTA